MVHACIVRLRSVRDSATGTEYRFGCDLIGHSKVWSDRVWVGMRELAVAGGLVLGRPQTAAHGCVRYVEAGTLHAAMFFLPQVGVIPTHAVFERQLASDLPTVLQV